MTLTHNHDLWSFRVSELSWYYQGGLYLRRYYQGGWSQEVELCIAPWAWIVNFWIWAVKSGEPSQPYLLKYGDFLKRPKPATSPPQSFAELKQHKFESVLLWLCRPTNQPNSWQPTTKQNKLSAKQKMLSQLAPFQTTNDPPDHLLSSLEALKFFLLQPNSLLHPPNCISNNDTSFKISISFYF